MGGMQNSRGDTIVEVLIAMAVASAILGSSFLVVNRTLKNSRQAQEHSEVLKIAQSQLEQLKAYAGDPTHAAALNSVLSTNKPFCMVDGSPVNFSAAAISNTLPQIEAAYPVGCKQLGTVDYRTGIIYEPGTASPYDDVYVAQVDWPGATGGQDKVSLSYRIYRP
jgi:type II secretory pathway pseudopilin PulG